MGEARVLNGDPNMPKFGKRANGCLVACAGLPFTALLALVRRKQ